MFFKTAYSHDDPLLLNKDKIVQDIMKALQYFFLEYKNNDIKSFVKNSQSLNISTLFEKPLFSCLNGDTDFTNAKFLYEKLERIYKDASVSGQDIFFDLAALIHSDDNPPHGLGGSKDLRNVLATRVLCKNLPISDHIRQKITLQSSSEGAYLPEVYELTFEAINALLEKRNAYLQRQPAIELTSYRKPRIT